MLHVNQRQTLYQFFAALFTHPGAELMQSVSNGDVEDAAKLLGVEAPDSSVYELSQDELAEQFAGLFIARMGGVPAPLYGSVYLDDGLLMGPSTARVAEAYRNQGLVFEDATEPADYLATELEFLYFLVGKEESGFKGRDLAAAQAATASQHEFLQTSLLPWLEQFVERLKSVDGATLYHWGAAALLSFCRQEKEWLGRLPGVTGSA